MRVLPTRWRRKPAGMNRNYVTVTLCRNVALPLFAAVFKVVVSSIGYGLSLLSFSLRGHGTLFLGVAESITERPVKSLLHPVVIFCVYCYTSPFCGYNTA